MKSRIPIYLLFIASILLYGCKEGVKWHYATGATWGTIYHIKYLSDKDLSDSIVHEMQLIDESLSPFNTSSLISHINRGDDVACDSMFSDVFRLSQEVCRLSDGAFDPTVAPLINLWGFGYKQGSDDRPSQQQIDSALVNVGILQCTIDTNGHVKRKSEHTEFNFSAIAKGYGIDRIASMLERNGCSDYMVEIGGELAIKGKAPSGEKWQIQIDAPVVDTGNINHKRIDMLRITNACIATSGNYRNHRSTSEGEVGHTISAVTGMPVSSSTLSVTIIAPNTAMADALATAVMAMPDTAAIAMLEKIDGVGALLVKASSNDDYEIITTEAFELYRQ